MAGRKCSYRHCESTTKLNGNLHFFHYPVKYKERCKEWIKNTKRPKFYNLPDDKLRKKVVCNLHFETKFFTNALRNKLIHNAVPSMQDGFDAVCTSELKDLQIVPVNDDGTKSSVDTNSMQQKSAQIYNNQPVLSFTLKNGALVEVFSDKQSAEQVLYTIDEEDLKPVSYREQSDNAKNLLFIDPNKLEQPSECYKIVFNREGTHKTYERKK